MAIKIDFDVAHNPQEPTIVLAKRNGDKLGKINAHDIEIVDSLNNASEITFNVNKYLDGEKDYLWDKLTDFKLLYCVEWDEWFEARIEIDESNETVKTCFGTQLAASELGQIMLYNIQINTEDDIAREEYVIPTVLYNAEHPEASLLNRLTEKAPHYSVAHVDDTIKNIQRTFDFDDTSIYDAFQDIAEEIGCLFVFGEQDEGKSVAKSNTDDIDKRNIIIALDPGHGGSDGGAQGNGLSESEVCLKIAQFCKEELEKYLGVSVFMTRTDDEYVDLAERVNRAVDASASILVSLHCNSFNTPDAFGGEVIVPNESTYLYNETHVFGRELGEKILDNIVNLGISKRSVYSKDCTNDSRYLDGSLQDYYTVIANSRERGIPAIIVEHAFISNESDALFLDSDDDLRRLGLANAVGIAEQYGLSKAVKNATAIPRTISVYDLESTCLECEYRGDFVDVCPECGSVNINDGYGEDTGIFVTADELASDIQLTTDTDQIKNCFKLEAGDDMMNATIRNCNPNGSDYIWYLSDAMKEDMSDELVAKIESYDEEYANYYKTKDYASLIDNGLLEKYNEIVNKYKDSLNAYLNDEDDYDNAYKEYLIATPIIGYPSIMDVYYDAIDMAIFLKSAMMPTFKLSDTTAVKEAEKLTAANLSPVAAADEKTLTNMSVYTADNIVLSVAKIVADSRYKVVVANSSFDKEIKVWTGSFTLTNYSDEDDTASSQTINVQMNADYEQFVKMKLDKALDNADKEDMSISGLFKKDISKNETTGEITGAFVDELKKYGLNRLDSFHNSCQTCVDVLIEQGIADNETWGKSSDESMKTIYDDLYMPYRWRLEAIELEMAVRQADVDIIAGVLDEDGDLKTTGLQNNIEDVIKSVQKELDFEKYLGEDLWLEFCSFRREDKYSNDNYISDGLSNAEVIAKANEFIKVAKREIYKSAELQTSISADLNNLLVMKKFEPLADGFQVGNWIRTMVDDVVYKLRLIEYSIDYSSINEISVEFADEVKNKSTIKSVQDILSQASSMATSYDFVKRQAKQGEESNVTLNGWFENGLNATNTKIVGGSDGQSQTWDDHGMLFRKFDPATNEYEPEQMKIINSTLAVTDDNWKTTKAAVGKFYRENADNPGEIISSYGVNAETIVGQLLLGENLIIDSGDGAMTFDNNGLIVRNRDRTVTVAISPQKDEVIDISNKEESVFNVNEDGELYISGNIMARSLSLDSGVEIEGDVIKNLANVAYNGLYDSLVWSNGTQGQVVYLGANGRIRAKTLAYSELSGIPSLHSVATSGSYNDLTNKPALKTVATSGSYNDLTNKPALKAVATSGNYTDLIGSTANAGKLLYVDTDGSVTTLSIDGLKSLLGI